MRNLRIVVLLAFLWSIVGCGQRILPAHVRVQVFEVSSLVMDHYIPPEQRTAAPQSAYFVTLDKGALASDLLLQGIHNDAGLLCDDSLDFYGWPPPAQSLSYPALAGVNPVNGTLTGWVGIRSKDSKKELQIDCKVTHNSRSIGDTPTIDSRLFDVGPAPQGPILFVAPFQRENGDKRAHVVVFSVTGK